MKKIIKIGVPATLHGFIQMSSNILLIMMMTRIPGGTDVVSAYSVGMVVFGLTTFPAASIATVAASMVGVNLGNSDQNRAISSGFTCAITGAMVITFTAILTRVFAPELLKFFVKDLSVIKIGDSLLKTLSLVMPVHALGIVFSRGMQGAGDAKTPFIIAALTGVGARVPLAYIFTFSMGMQSKGIWLAIAVTQVISAVILTYKFKTVVRKRAENIKNY